jgi:hypothetical protein
VDGKPFLMLGCLSLAACAQTRGARHGFSYSTQVYVEVLKPLLHAEFGDGDAYFSGSNPYMTREGGRVHIFLEQDRFANGGTSLREDGFEVTVDACSGDVIEHHVVRHG